MIELFVHKSVSLNRLIWCNSKTDGIESGWEKILIVLFSYAPRGTEVHFFMNISYMKEAIEYAKKGMGFTNPNPLVGAVIVKDGKIIGRGYHEYYGGLHAERNAIKNACDKTNGADMYVTLEPCSHQGKQPPCTKAIVDAGIKRVYIGSRDPNPLVSGKGVEYLRNHGIEVVEDVLKDECDALNDIFFHYITTNRPYVIMKISMTADGKTATYTGHSRWITNSESRDNSHLTRKRVAGIMVGINTVLVDDPMLNCRCDNPSNPLRIICDSDLRIPMDCNIVKTAGEIPTLIATVSNDKKKIENLVDKGIEVIVTSGEKVNLCELMDELGKRKIDSILVEGGATLHWSILNENLVNELQLYIAPKIIGGSSAKPAVGGKGVELLTDAFMFDPTKVEMFGKDVLITYKKVRQ